MTNDTITEPSALSTVVDAYIASWHEADPARRTALVEQAWAPQARYVDPLLDLTGHEQLATLAPVLAEHYPGHSIRRTSEVDAHHGFGRFSWELTGPDGAVVIAGIDVCSIADDGRLQGIAGFFDQ
ncbi:MAG: nuclear transport factor 2 family protein [Acidimicrobiales bacterium]